MALGAQRGRLIAELLLESAMLCAAAGVLGYAIAAAAVARFSNVTITLPMYGSFGMGLNLHMSWSVVAGTAVLVLIALLAAGLVPALYASSPNLSQMLAGEVVVGGTRKNARRNALVIVQVAVCTLVLVGMGLCTRNLYNLRHADVGFAARNLVAEALFVKQEGISEAQGRLKYAEIRRAAAALPGAEAVTLASELPLFGQGQAQVRLPGADKSTPVRSAVVDADYFSTLEFRRLSGRVFDSRDQEKTPGVVVINHKMAEMYWPGQDPLGQTLLTDDPARPATVIGVVADGKYDDLAESAQSSSITRWRSVIRNWSTLSCGPEATRNCGRSRWVVRCTTRLGSRRRCVPRRMTIGLA